MNTSDFDYDLPPELIAQVPAERREDARMLVVNRAEQSWEHRRVRDLPDYLRRDDLLVLNNTKVIPARLFGTKPETGGKVEFLLLEELEPNVWEVLLKASRRPRPGARVVLKDGVSEIEMIEDGVMGRARVRVHCKRPFLDVLDDIGIPPLPPYISRDYDQERPEDRERYQTVFAAEPGAVAAPTAGLHFTPELFDRLAVGGVRRTEVTLHVGIGTFRPVAVEQVQEHVMDEERYEVRADTVQAVQDAHACGGRVVAVGSTSVRTLETVAARNNGMLCAGRGRSDLFIYPPYTFQIVDVMLTNFHLPRSTLLMMVCALAGRDFMLKVYREAVREQYRFFSYGDCMLIV